MGSTTTATAAGAEGDRDAERDGDDEQEDEATRTDPPPGGEAVIPIENEVIEALVARGWTIAVAESLTGGAVAARLCSCPGTEGRMSGGMVSYSTESKRRLLDVEGPVVSGAAATQMARRIRELFGSEVGLSLTGVAGPERQEDQPVGTVFVGWSTPESEGCRQLSCAGAPEQIRRQAAERSLGVLVEALRQRTGR
jgi:PncC family amidohydrolase